MAAPKRYNGHRSWNAWNVSLWIANDEPLYRRAVELYRKFPTATCAARHFLEELPAKTPDGAAFNLKCVREAVARKVAEGEIHIGEPPLKPGEWRELIDGKTRYAVVSP